MKRKKSRTKQASPKRNRYSVEFKLRAVRLFTEEGYSAVMVAQELGGPLRVVDWADRARVLSQAGLLVNTTSLGMVGQPPLDLDLSELPRTAVVNDIVYTPLETPLLAQAAMRGNSVVDGLGMLLHQARPGFEAWFGVKPEVTDELRRFVMSD